jgi:molybdenum-dependent DNA-binding transcriptional regulator ModE
MPLGLRSPSRFASTPFKRSPGLGDAQLKCSSEDVMRYCAGALSTPSLQGSNRNLSRGHKVLLYSPNVDRAAMTPTPYPSLRQLRVFEAVARHKSIGRAARLVGLSQPAVTQTIASLENRFGVALFERGRRGSYPTDFGTMLLARTERLFDFIREGLRRLLTSHPSSEPADINALTGKITTTHIRCLIAVSENMSFDQAARSIGVSQPSLNRAAREFERNLRRAIYHRGARHHHHRTGHGTGASIEACDARTGLRDG